MSNRFCRSPADWQSARQLRCEGGALSGGRSRVAVDAGEGSGGWLDAGSRGCVGHRLWHAVRLHDFRSIWSQSGAEQGYTVSEPLSSSLTAEVIVLINVFTVDSANQQRLVDILTN